MKIGIDFSLTSPSMCVETEKYYRFISLFDKANMDWKNSRNKKFHYHRELDGKIDLYSFNRIIDKSDYRKEQYSKLKCAVDLSDYIVQTITRELTRSDEPVLSCDNPITIAIEGFSYSSKSSSYIDLVMYQSILRSKLFENFPYMKLHIIPPTEIKKKFTGKGNATKEEMIKSFINITEDEKLLKTKLHKYCKEQELDYNNIKPIDDLIDAFGILKSI